MRVCSLALPVPEVSHPCPLSPIPPLPCSYVPMFLPFLPFLPPLFASPPPSLRPLPLLRPHCLFGRRRRCCQISLPPTLLLTHRVSFCLCSQAQCQDAARVAVLVGKLQVGLSEVRGATGGSERRGQGGERRLGGGAEGRRGRGTALLMPRLLMLTRAMLVPPSRPPQSSTRVPLGGTASSTWCPCLT